MSWEGRPVTMRVVCMEEPNWWAHGGGGEFPKGFAVPRSKLYSGVDGRG